MAPRGARLAERVGERGLDLLLVTELVNVRYLTGFGGTNGACVCGPSARAFLTDFRYTERAAEEVEGWDVVTVEGDWLAGVAERLSGRVGFEDDHLSVRTLGRLEKAAGEGTELVAAGGEVEGLRRVKEPAELGAIAAAAELADEIYRWSLERGLGGRTEADIAAAAQARMRELGAEPSFPPIVAGGPNGALPHAEPGQREIRTGDLVVFDMGAELEGYCSDCTRTFAVGEPSSAAREVYELVAAAQAAGLEALAPGAECREVDAVAREVIEAAGHGDRFGHGLGHGVGMEVHEAPRLGPRSDDVLQSGDVVTVEPGVYLPGELGVRIEDLVALTAEGPRNLSALPKRLQVVD
ncbi:MAG: aminopeptidase P family protein [Solirubrobacterales bacterium]